MHTLKKKIDYAQSMAITRHGVLGIKVWVSYSLNGDEKALDNREKEAPKRSVARGASIIRSSTQRREWNAQIFSGEKLR